MTASKTLVVWPLPQFLDSSCYSVESATSHEKTNKPGCLGQAVDGSEKSAPVDMDSLCIFFCGRASYIYISLASTVILFLVL